MSSSSRHEEGGERLVGAPVRRREDRRFLTGEGRFTDDLHADAEVHAAVLRSPHPHALIRDIDVAAARAVPGVLAVLLAEDLAAEGVTSIPSMTRVAPYAFENTDGSALPDASQPVLATDRVRYLGEAVAFVVAESATVAQDAVELIALDYGILDAVIDAEAAMEPRAVRIWDELPDNRSLDWTTGDQDRVERAFGNAHRIVRAEVVNNRVAPVFLEPRAALASYEDGRFTLWSGSQSAHGLHRVLTGMLGVDDEALRVVTPDTGGGFGARNAVYPEFVLVLVAARRLGRPVRWVASRSEGFLTDTQARDQVMRGELALDDSGRFSAVRMSVVWRHGSYVPSRNLWVIINYMPLVVCGTYRIGASSLRIRGVFTNTTPQAAYRGIGRAEVIYLLETLVDRAAAELGESPVALRRRNLVQPHDMPWSSPAGAQMTSGEFEANMDRALELIDACGFDARRREAAARGRRRGLGVALYIENDGGAPVEFAEVEALEDGRVCVYAGTQNFGMGHETIYAQIVSDSLGIELEQVVVIDGDTQLVRTGFGSHGSRSARIGGTATLLGAEKLIEEGRRAASDLLEAASTDIDYRAGAYRVRGTDRTVTLADVARQEARAGRKLSGDVEFATQGQAYANGCQACEVEIDPETGALAVVDHVIVADVGRAVNPMIVEGQLHGGVAQGIGQAVFERVVYDFSSGQTLTGSFMDYTVPRADDLPYVRVELNEVGEADNPLGVKGAGEGPTTGAPPAVMSAVRDALGNLELDMPLISEQIWRALRAPRA